MEEKIVWILYAVLVIGQGEIILRPIYIYEVQEYCETDKDTLQPFTSVPLTCTTLERDL